MDGRTDNDSTYRASITSLGKMYASIIVWSQILSTQKADSTLYDCIQIDSL